MHFVAPQPGRMKTPAGPPRDLAVQNSQVLLQLAQYAWLAPSFLDVTIHGPVRSEGVDWPWKWAWTVWVTNSKTLRCCWRQVSMVVNSVSRVAPVAIRMATGVAERQEVDPLHSAP